MFIDAGKPGDPLTLTGAVCIIGGGLAGLIIALELARHRVPVVVLESGGLAPDAATRDLARGESRGIPYLYADGCRSRFLGGSSNCWGGWCRPLEPLDFERRAWVPHSGWPLSSADLVPFYARAHEWLRLGPQRYDTAFWVPAIRRPDVRALPLEGSELEDRVSQFSTPVRMGLDHRDELRRSRHATVCLHANLTEFRTEDATQRLQTVLARSLGGRIIEVHAGLFVLATGGIENARLLLGAAPRHPAGLGNGNDLVGRFFMDHPRIHAGAVQWRAPWRRNKLYDHKFHYKNPRVAAHGTEVGAQLMPRESLQAREGLLHSNLWFDSVLPGEGTPAGLAVIRMKHRLARKEKQGHTFAGDLATMALSPLDACGFIVGRVLHPAALVRGVRMTAMVECEPDPASRVILGEARDALGLRRAVVDWRLSENVLRTFDATFALVADTLEVLGVANVQRPSAIAGHALPAGFEYEGTWHHMGTTRMHASPRRGVVDADCRMHEVPNLFVAGSSVFPTSGVNYPSITVAALAVRLADRLRAELAELNSPRSADTVFARAG